MCERKRERVIFLREGEWESEEAGCPSVLVSTEGLWGEWAASALAGSAASPHLSGAAVCRAACDKPLRPITQVYCNYLNSQRLAESRPCVRTTTLLLKGTQTLKRERANKRTLFSRHKHMKNNFGRALYNQNMITRLCIAN